MTTNNPKVTAARGKINYTPFAKSNISEDWSELNSFYGIPEAVDLIKKRMYISYQFDGSVQSRIPGFRAGGFGVGDDPDFRWMHIITGLSGGCTANGLFTTPLGTTVDWTYKPIAAMVGVTPGTPLFKRKLTTSGAADAGWTEAELNQVIPGSTGLSGFGINYRHYLYATNLNWQSWTSTNPSTPGNYDFTTYLDVVQNQINGLWSPSSPAGSTFKSYFGTFPNYLAINPLALDANSNPTEIQLLLGVDVDITTPGSTGQNLLAGLTGLLVTTKNASPNSNVTQYQFPFFPWFIFPKPDGTDAANWNSCTWCTTPAEFAAYDAEKTRLIGKFKEKVKAVLPYSDSISVSTYPFQTEIFANTFGTNPAMQQWVFNTCLAAKQEADTVGKKVVNDITYVIDTNNNGEWNSGTVAVQNKLPLANLTLNDLVNAMPSMGNSDGITRRLVHTDSYIGNQFLEPIKWSGVERVNFWGAWKFWWGVAAQSAVDSTDLTVRQKNFDIMFCRKIINDLFFDRSSLGISQISLTDNNTWASTTTKNNVLKAAVDKEKALATLFRANPFSDWIAGYGFDTTIEQGCIKEWYKWGIRKFWFHMPFGKTPIGLFGSTSGTDAAGAALLAASGAKLMPDALAYQPDAYVCAKEGFVDAGSGRTGNVPMPWLTDDVVDGKVQGFVPLFKALISGSSAGLSTEVWERLTGQNTEMGMWYDPNDPIELTVYLGTINGETYPRWRRWFDAGQSVLPDTNGFPAEVYARGRLQASYEPLIRAGIRVGLDALVGAPGPTKGFNAAYNGIDYLGGFRQFTYNGEKYHQAYPYLPSTGAAPNDRTVATFGNADDPSKGWWKTFSEYIVPNFGKNNIFMESNAWTYVTSPEVTPTPGITMMNPYVEYGGINVASADEWGRNAYNVVNSPPFAPMTSRPHYLQELGSVEYLTSLPWNSATPHIGYVNTALGITMINSKFWYLQSVAEKANVTVNYGNPNEQYPLNNGHVFPWIESSFSGNFGYEDASGVPGRGPEDYLRAKRSWAPANNPFNDVDGTNIWGHYWAADNLAHRERLGNDYVFSATAGIPNIPVGTPGNTLPSQDPTTFFQDPTNQGILYPFTVLKSTLADPLAAVNASGITKDFRLSFPPPISLTQGSNATGITAFARFVAGIKSGVLSLDPKKPIDAPIYPPTATEIVKDAAQIMVKSKRIDGIEGVLILYPEDYDRYCGNNTGLNGSKSGVFSLPEVYPINPSTGFIWAGNSYEAKGDINPPKISKFLDMKIMTWKERFGVYPKYVVWKPTPNGGQAWNQQPNWQMYRYLQVPKRIATTAVETPDAFAVRENYYGEAWVNSNGLIENKGIGSAIEQGSILLPDGYDIYADAKYQLQNLVKVTKDWRDSRGIPSKVGLYQFPFLPHTAYPVYGVSGGQAVLLEVGGWNDSVFPKGNTSTSPNVGGTFGWYTPSETQDLKKRIKLEFRKRYEPVAKFCEVVMPEILQLSPYEIQNDTKNEYYRAWQRETLNLAFDLKTKRAWNVATGADNPPSLENADIIPIITPEYMGNEVVSGLTKGDPLTLQDGTLFDHDKMNYNNIDWIRDEFLRPVRGIPQKIQGMCVWNRYLGRGLTATRLTAGASDRQWIYKWLRADGGSGVTFDGSSADDIKNNAIKFFRIRKNLSKQYLNRFSKGQPRKDVVEPYRHSVFASTWNAGYSGSHPPILDGTPITDIYPFAWLGWKAVGGSELRPPGNTEGPSTELVNSAIYRLKNTPAGRRVLLPYYFFQDPISDHSNLVEYYKQTIDGTTYTGILPLRTHELPGPFKIPTPWAYRQTEEAKQSFSQFLNRCISAGVTFDYIADDCESWVHHTVASNISSFEGAFGPTGMPAIFNDINATDYPSLPPTRYGFHVYPWEGWRYSADPRTLAYTKDSRFASLGNSYDGSTLGGSIEKKYTELLSTPAFTDFCGSLISRNSSISSLSDVGNSAARIMQYYTLEGPLGISAATGPKGATVYATTFPPTSNDSKWSQPSFLLNPFRTPFSSREDSFSFGGTPRTVHRYAAFLASTSAIQDLVMGDLYKKMYIDTIGGSTSAAHRNIKYNHYDVFPVGVTESPFTSDPNGHPHYASIFPHVAPAPFLYGESTQYTEEAKYSLVGSTDYRKHSLVLSYHQVPEGVNPWNDTASYSFFTNATQNIAARSYIATLREIGKVRAMLRTNPISWREFAPWVNSPYDRLFTHSYREDLSSPAIDVWKRTDISYWDELIHHCLLSGAKYFNYFLTGSTLPSNEPYGIGYTAGMVRMQKILTEWNSLSEGYRTQPCSNFSGDTTKLVDRLDISSAGGNHSGATGTFTSGSVILKENIGKIPNPVFGTSAALENKTYIWRITAAPQGDKLYLAGGFTAELPNEINLITGEIKYGLSAGMSGSNSGSFFEQKNRGGSINYTSDSAILSLPLGIPNSFAELRHNSYITPASDPIDSFLVGDGKSITFKFNGSLLDATPGNASTPYGTPGTIGGLSIVGLFDCRQAFGRHGVNGNELGIENCISFFTIRGSVWGVIVTFKNPSTGQYRVFKELLLDQDGNGNYIYSPFIPHDLRIEVDASGVDAKFYIDGTLVRTINANTIASDGAPLGGMPTKEFAKEGLWAGAGVRDITLSNRIGDGIIANPDTMQCRSMSAVASIGLAPEKILVSRRGVWIKSKRSSLMPQYKISSPAVPAQLPPGYLEEGTGFPSNPDAVFSNDPLLTLPTQDMTVKSDLLPIAAWKDNPIPFADFQSVTSPSTVTLMAFHPSGIRKVEASLDGGRITVLNGAENSNIQEFTFNLPLLTQIPPFTKPLSPTNAGATYGGMHQVRAKIFPFNGIPRILGGYPEENSTEYRAVDPVDPTPKKIQTNETSFFFELIFTSDPKYGNVTVNGSLTDNDPQSNLYKDVRDAIMWELGDGSGTSGAAKKKDFLVITLAGAPRTYTIPSFEDASSFVGIPSPLTVSFPNPERKTVIIRRILTSGTTAPSFTPFIENGSSKSNTSYNAFSPANFATTWTDTNQVWSSVLPIQSTSYSLFGTPTPSIYRINTDPLTAYFGSTASQPSISNPQWQLMGTETSWNVDNARVATFYGIGRVAFIGSVNSSLPLTIDRAKIPNFFSTSSTQSLLFRNVRFTSSVTPSFDPLDFVRNGNVSYINCVTDPVVGGMAHGFQNSNRIIGCTAIGVRGNAFGNSSLVLNSNAIGLTKSDKTNPSLLGRFVYRNVSGDARVRHNCIFSGVSASGRNYDVVSLGRNEARTLESEKFRIAHYDLLYDNIKATNSVGIADRFEGSINNVHFIGVSMPNGVIFTPEYRNALVSSTLPRTNPSKIYFDEGSRIRMAMVDPSTRGLAQNAFTTVFTTVRTRRFNSSFGVLFGNPLSPNNDQMVSIRPRRPDQVSLGIKGIPHVYFGNFGSKGNTISQNFTITNPVTGIKTFGLQMGGGFGYTFPGLTTNALTFASWTRGITFDSTPITPTLSWVYSTDGGWTSSGGLVFDFDNFSTLADFNIGISSGSSGDQVNLSTKLQTFFNSADLIAPPMIYDENSLKDWILMRTYNTSSDSWENSAVAENINPAHWLMVGDGVSSWLEGNLTIRGTGAGESAGQIVISTKNNASAQRLAFGLTLSPQGLTIEDQYGNIFTAAGSTAFTVQNNNVVIPGSSVLYRSGTLVGTPWTAAGVIGSFPREWNYNGTIIDQYAPMKFKINIGNTPNPSPVWSDMLNLVNGTTQAQGATLLGINTPIPLDVSFDNLGTYEDLYGSFKIFKNGVAMYSTGLSFAKGGSPSAASLTGASGDFIQFVYGPSGGGNTWGYSTFSVNVLNSHPFFNTPVNLETLVCSTISDQTPNTITFTNPLTDPSTTTTSVDSNVMGISGINRGITLGIVTSVTTSFGNASTLQVLKDRNANPSTSVLSVGLRNTGTFNNTIFVHPGEFIKFRLDSRQAGAAGTVTITNQSLLPTPPTLSTFTINSL